MNKLKAFNVQAWEAGCVVFAEKSVVARRIGANILNVTFEEVESCRRFPEVDHFSDIGHVSTKILVEEHNWYASCTNCGNYVYSTEQGRHWLTDENVICSKLICRITEL